MSFKVQMNGFKNVLINSSHHSIDDDDDDTCWDSAQIIAYCQYNDAISYEVASLISFMEFFFSSVETSLININFERSLGIYSS